MARHENINLNQITTESGKRITLSGTAAPTVGTYAVGDTVINNTPTAGGVYCWVCTTAGTPGTWKTVVVAA